MSTTHSSKSLCQQEKDKLFTQAKNPKPGAGRWTSNPILLALLEGNDSLEISILPLITKLIPHLELGPDLTFPK